MKGVTFKIVDLAIVAVTILFVANIPEVILARRIGLFPYHFYVGAIGLFFSFAIFSKVFLNISRINMYVISWFAFLILISALSLLTIRGDQVAIDTLITTTLFALIAITFTLCLTDRSRIESCLLGVFIATILLVLGTFVEFFNPDIKFRADVLWESKYEIGEIQRIGGLNGNPNANAYAMSLALFVGQLILPKPVRLIFSLVVGLAVATTASRSGIAIWIMVFLVSAILGLYGKGFSITRVLSLAMVPLILILLVSGQMPAIFETLGLTEYMPKETLVRFSSSFLDQVDEGSGQARLEVAAFLWEQFSSNPIFGIGLGQSGSGVSEFGIASHNMLLRMAAEMGIIGLLLYVGMICIPVFTRSMFGFVFIALFFCTNMFTNTSFDKPIFAILVPVACLYFASDRHSKRRKATAHGSRRLRRRSRKRAHVDGAY